MEDKSKNKYKKAIYRKEHSENINWKMIKFSMTKLRERKIYL